MMRSDLPANAGDEAIAAVVPVLALVFLGALWCWLRVATDDARSVVEVREAQLVALAALQQRCGAGEPVGGDDLLAVRGMFGAAEVVWTRHGDTMFLIFDHDSNSRPGATGVPIAR